MDVASKEAKAALTGVDELRQKLRGDLNQLWIAVRDPEMADKCYPGKYT